MKPTQITELFANIKKTFVSFFSILMFVALGVGIYLGISWVAPALQGTSDKVFDEGSFHDFQIQFPYGLTDDDLKQLSDVEGVSDVEAGFLSYQTVVIGNKKNTVKLQSMGEHVNTLTAVEGELPAKPDEIALNAEAAEKLGFGVGDTVTFKKDATGDDAMALLNADDPTSQPAPDEDGMKYLNSDSYKVTALVHSPEYIATSNKTYGYSTTVSGSVEMIGWVPIDAFDKSAFQDGFPLVSVRCESLRGINSFSNDYKQKAAVIEDRISELGTKLADARYDDLHGQAQKKIDEYDQQLADAKQQIADGEQQLAEARETLETQRAYYEAQLASAYQELIYYESLKADADAKLAEAKKLYPEGIAALDKMKDDETIVIEGHTYTAKELRAMLPEIEKGMQQAQSEYDAKVAELNAGWAKYYAGQAEFNARVAEGEQQIADGEAKIEDAKRQVAENEPKLEDAKAQLAAMKDYSWSISGRSSNAGAVNISVFSDVTTNLSFSMALLFVIVGLLVSYSAVSRIVHEQITQIGTKKALGLRKREITMSFLLYAGIAVLAGAIVGTIVGFIAVEGIIAHALSSMFIFGSFPSYFGLPLFLVVTALELALVLAATYLACHGILKKHAVELLRGEEPPAAKTRFYEKWKVWDKLSLFTQIIVNNCVNDKRRVFSTVVGVAGCTALIVTAITLNNDVLKSYDRHYENVYGFSDIAYVDNLFDGAVDDVEKIYRDEGSATVQVFRKSALLRQPGGAANALNLLVPADADAFAQVYHVNPVSGVEFDPAAEGVWVTQAYAEHFGAKVGDEIEVDLLDGVTHKLPILGIYEFWLTYHEMVIGGDYYEKEFGVEPAANAVLANRVDASLDEVTAKLVEVEGFDSAIDDKTGQYGDFATFSTVSSAVVLIYLVLSALMAVVVLLNLNVMFIDEKKRELIVLMINGFSMKDAKRYIYNDTIVLTVIGIILGVVLGCIMGAITVGSMEPSTASFVKDVDWIAVLVGVVGSAILAAIMCIIALRRIPRFELTDINKF